MRSRATTLSAIETIKLELTERIGATVERGC